MWCQLSILRGCSFYGRCCIDANLCKHNQFVSWLHDSLDAVNALFCRGGLNVDKPEGVSGFGDVVSSDSIFCQKFSSSVDALSLIQLLAASMIRFFACVF